MVPRTAALYCSFCGKEKANVFMLIAGPAGVNICDGCIEASAEIVAEKRAEAVDGDPAASIRG